MSYHALSVSNLLAHSQNLRVQRTLIGTCLLFLAFICPILISDHLPQLSTWMCDDLHWNYGLYLGPLWRDHVLTPHYWGIQLQFALLNPVTGAIGLAAAYAVHRKAARIHKWAIVPTWMVLVLFCEVALGLWGFGTFNCDPLNYDRTFWGQTLSEILNIHWK